MTSRFHEPWNEAYYYGEDRRSDRDRDVTARRGHTFASTWHEITSRAEQGPVFVKDFVYSVEHDLDDPKLSAITHTFLIRDPLIGSCRAWPSTGRTARGTRSASNRSTACSTASPSAYGHAPPVMSSADLLDEPEGTARAYCAAVGIGFDAAASVVGAG